MISLMAFTQARCSCMLSALNHLISLDVLPWKNCLKTINLGEYFAASEALKEKVYARK